MQQILIILLSIALYNILAIILKLPRFNIKRARAMMSGYEKTGWLSEYIDNFSEKLSKFIKLSVMKKSKIQKLLSLAHSSETPEQFTAKSYVYMILPLPLVVVFLFANPMLAVFPVILSAYLYRRCYNTLKEEGNKRQRNIENEILKFTMYMTSSLKSERNIIRLIEQYKANFDTPLTEELTLTLAEMKTGNYEKALANMSKRNNSNAVNGLVNGLISSLQGNDMTVYFENLSYELTSEWEQTLKRQAMEQEPKISKLSMILFAIAVVTIFAVLITGLTSSNMLMGGF
ncbi:MAG: hypothetical protein R3Y35_11850 [Clostridia bacterium]